MRIYQWSVWRNISQDVFCRCSALLNLLAPELNLTYFRIHGSLLHHPTRLNSSVSANNGRVVAAYMYMSAGQARIVFELKGWSRRVEHALGT